MNLFSKLALGAAALTGTVTIGTTAIQAAQPDTANPMSKLVTAIATKFNLNSADVQQVFDDQRALMDQERATRQAERQKEALTQAVTNGDLTQAQADLITAKQTEVKTFMDSLKDKSETDRQAAMQTEMDSLKQWAQDNGIDERYLMLGGPGHRGPGPEGQGFGQPPTDQATQVPASN